MYLLKRFKPRLRHELVRFNFSFSGIHIKSLTREISCVTNIDIAGRYKPIITDKWDPTIDNKKRLKVVHLECDKKEEKKARSQLKI